MILGKNGCGKSTLLKAIENQSSGANIGKKKYVTPERGGALIYEAGIGTRSRTRDGSRTSMMFRVVFINCPDGADKC